MNVPTSPTYCRPQHLDRERLRRLLARDDFESVCFHEAVIIVNGDSAPGYQLLALTRDALLLFPLGSGGGGSASPAGLPPVATRVRWADVVAVVRVSPTQTKLRGMLLHGTSELFEITTQQSRRLFVATFEPNSRALFSVQRAFCLEFQKRIVMDGVPPPLDDVGDLHDLLQDLLDEVSTLDDDDERCGLLDELATAATTNHILQKLCFEDQTALGSSVVDGQIAYGLPAFLLLELALLVTTSTPRLTYELSLLQLLHRLLFDGHAVAARLRFFLHTPYATWLAIVTHVPTLAASERTDDWCAARDELVDLQAPLVLELQLLHEEAALLEPQGTLAPLTGGTNDAWSARVLKRLAVLLSRTPMEISAAENGAYGSHWSLALWRITKVVRKLLRIAIVQGDHRVASELRVRRRDYIDLYLRNPRFGSALVVSTVPHLVDVAHDLVEILDMLS